MKVFAINILLGVCLLFTHSLCAQSFVFTNGVTDNTCTGTFYDSGGSSGAGYSANENSTYTICSDGSSGVAIKVTFDAFNLDSKDTLTVFDGANNTASVLGKYTNDDLLGLTLIPTTSNTGGCLTFNFVSDNSLEGFWSATLNCGNKCTFPTAVITGPQEIKLCPGNNVALDATASTAGSGNISQYQWFSKKDTVVGSTYNSSFPNPKGLIVELRVTNSLGCTSINKEQVKIMVSTPPNFLGTSGDDSICLGEQACFKGVATGIAYQEPVPTYNGGALALPDLVGVCFSSTLNYNIFTPGQKLNDINDLQGVCVNMEHSYIQDLTIKLTCPNGQNVLLHNVAGGGRYMGTPVDDDAKPNQMGSCGKYCWTPNTANGLLQTTGAEGQTIPFGDYKSIQPLTNLLGCPLNGTWTFEICDQLHGDNGFLCSWDLNFNPALIPQGISFTPSFNMNTSDSTAWNSDPTVISTSADGDNICAIPTSSGDKQYTYQVTNNFGCTYDTTLSVKVFDYPKINLNDTIFLCASASMGNINASLQSAALGTFSYLWTPSTGLNQDNILTPTVNVPLAQNSYILEVNDSGTPGCIAKDTVVIKKNPVPQADFTMNKTGGCVPLTVIFKDNTAPKPNNFSWIFDDGTQVTGTVDTAIHTFNTYGIKTITYIISTGTGCSDTISKTIDASPIPLVLFNVTPPYAYQDYPYFCFQNVTQFGGTQNTWLFDTIATSSNENDCFMFPDTLACYNVSLINTNNFGCTDTLTKQVCVRKPQQKIFAPTAFTPNKDGVNDKYFVKTESMENSDYNFYIFDRWGNQFFHSTVPNEGWDGTMSNGVAPIDVYLFVIYYKDEFGEQQKFIGHFSLIR